MFIIEMAKLKIKINNRFSFLEKLCKDYIIDEETYDFEVSVTDDDINKEKNASDGNFSVGYLESICIYRKISEKVPQYNCILLHAAVIKVDDDAYAFCAKSGTGKTTHTKLWMQLLGDKMSYINGDKPLIRIIDDQIYAFGTPWNGKEQYGTNSYAKLKAIAFIERDITNSIIHLPKIEVLPRIIHQILLPKDEDSLSKTFEILNEVVGKTNTYLLKCNMDIEAAQIAYTQMRKD